MSGDSLARVKVVHSFKFPAERVFDAWLNPELIGQWMFGPRLRNEEVVSIQVDGRLHGTFSFVVRRDGDELNHVGEYLEINRPQKLVFTWGMADAVSSRVTVMIVPAGKNAELTLVH